ncbi:MAG TPA: inosine/xanthosine triphosphatase [Candidatus Saccharimonadales bacterium]|nr:inosine/xanthosine triphosphatase [Candidatus Saccharimonadales bacterium]
MIIAVGSERPSKIDPVRTIFKKHFKDVEVLGVKVPSGVSDQPLHDDEMFQGALNRAKAALEKVPKATYGVGIEGGLHKYSYGWFERSTVVIVNKKGDIGIGSSGGLALPPKIMKQIEAGKNLEEACDALFGTTKIGGGVGMFGLLTNNVVTRASGIEHAVAFALARFLHEELY